MNIQTKLTLIIVSVTIVALLVSDTYIFFNTRTIIKEEVTKLEKSRVSTLSNEIGGSMQYYESQVLLARDLPPIQGLIRTEGGVTDPVDGSTREVWKSRLKTIFTRMEEVDPRIYQIRYINEKGKEVVRVDQTGGNVRVIGEDELQKKSDRGYFVETMKMAGNEVYISDLDLNIESGQIEIPYRPVLRFATSVFSATTSERKGIIIINIDMKEILDSALKSDISENLLLDSEGYYLFNEEEREKEFGKDLQTGENYFEEEPDIRDEIQTKDSSSYEHPNHGGEFGTWEKIRFDSSNKERYWVLLSVVSSEEVLAPVNEFRKFLVYEVIIVSLLAVALGTYFSRKISVPIKELNNTVRELRSGNYNARLNVNTKDEIQEVAETFNETIRYLGKVDDERNQIDKAKTEFLSITSHELRSPMTPMQAQLQMLLGNYFGKLNQKQKDSLEIVLRNTKRLDRIIQDFLEISRAEAGRLKFNFVKTNLTDHMARLTKEMNGFLPEKKIKIETKIGKLPVMEIDPDRVMQILRNLINNAKKFSPNGSTITISAELNREVIEFSVSDQGIGIPAEKQGNLFTPFYQVENMYQRKSGGTGLGLAICKGIVNAQGGKIWIESKQGKGTTFHFTFPLTPVREVKPIKLLFSNQENITKKMKELYREFLGPLGEDEFNRLHGKADSESLLSQIDELKKKKILNEANALRFKEAVQEALKQLESFIKEENSNLSNKSGEKNE